MKSNFVKIDETYNNRRVVKEVEPKKYGKRKELARRWLVECCNCGTQITMLNNDIRRSGCKVCHDLPAPTNACPIMYDGDKKTLPKITRKLTIQLPK